jgi:hypothetical protein
MAGDARAELRSCLAREERPEHHQRRVGHGVGFVGPHHRLDEVDPVAAAARGDEQEGIAPGLRLRRRLAPEIARVGQALGHARRQREPGERRVDLPQAVDPGRVVEGQHLERALALPFGGQQRRIVEHVAQTEHEAAAAGLEGGQHRQHLAVEARRLLVDEEEIRGEAPGDVADQGGARRHHGVEVVARPVAAVGAALELDDARQPAAGDPGREPEGVAHG